MFACVCSCHRLSFKKVGCLFLMELILSWQPESDQMSISTGQHFQGAAGRVRSGSFWEWAFGRVPWFLCSEPVEFSGLQCWGEQGEGRRGYSVSEPLSFLAAMLPVYCKPLVEFELGESWLALLPVLFKYCFWNASSSLRPSAVGNICMVQIFLRVDSTSHILPCSLSSVYFEALWKTSFVGYSSSDRESFPRVLNHLLGLLVVVLSAVTWVHRIKPRIGSCLQQGGSRAVSSL